MGTIHTFPARRLGAPSSAEMRAQIEEAAQAALDTADQLIAILDQIDEDPDGEDGGNAEPSLGAPEGHASQIVWLRGCDGNEELLSAEQR